MAGFANIKAWPDAEDAGKSWISSFRKTVSNNTFGNNTWMDYSYYPGSPPANFYASAPLEAAMVSPSRGIYVPAVAPAKQFVRNLKFMTLSPTSTSSACGRQQIMLIDQLLYYPFIDMDSLDEQVLVNDIAIPRYDGGKVFIVSQSPVQTGAGQFRFQYTNSEGVSGRTSQLINTFTCSGGGQVCHSILANNLARPPFCELQLGDTGVKSIQSVTFSSPAGGLMALVIAKPLITVHVTQESRTTTTGTIESFGACDEFVSVINHAPPRIIDGAVITMLAACHGGQPSSSILSGILETTWS